MEAAGIRRVRGISSPIDYSERGIGLRTYTTRMQAINDVIVNEIRIPVR